MGSNLVLRRLYVLFRNSSMLWAAFCCIDLYQGCNEGDTCPRAPNRCGAPIDYGWLQNVATMSQVLSSIQYICFRKTLGSNMGAPNFLLAPGAIQHRYAPDLYVFRTNGPTSRSSFVILDAEKDALKSLQLRKNNTLAKECGTRQKRNPTITRGLISN